jgi:amino acid adenylation domain-containing protein
MVYQHSRQKAAAADRNTKERDYWINRLAGELIKAVFYYDYKNAHAAVNPKKKLTFPLTGDTFKKLSQLSRNSPHALHMIFAAALTILLDRYTNLKDIIIGTPIYKQDIEGEFINTLLPLRNRVEDGMTFKEFLVQVKDTVTGAVENQNYPIETLLFKLNMEFSLHDFPLFDVMVMVENVHDKKYIQPINPNVIFSFLQTDEAVEGVVEYNAGLYTPTTIEGIIRHFTCLLQAILANLDLKLNSIPILTAKEKELILFELNDTKRPVERDGCYHQLFEEQAAKAPHRTAAIHNDKQITYGELNGKSNQLAALLRERGVIPDSLAAVFCERSIEMLTSIIGIFKAGGAYIPFEVDSPPQRIKTILKDSEAHVLLATSAAVTRAGTRLLYGMIGSDTEVRDIIFLDRPGETPWSSDPDQDRERFRTFKLASLLSKDFDKETYTYFPPLHREMTWRYEDQTLTYDRCQARMNRMRRFITAKELFKEKDRESPHPQAAVILDNPLHLMAILPVLKSLHISYIVITPPLNQGKKRELTDSLSISTIFSESRFLDEMDQLFWETRTLKNYIIVDHYDYKASKKESDLREVWDAAAGGSTEAVNDYRWNSIYTGEPFSLEEMNQYTANVRVKLKPYLTGETRVLEVGCGHGLVLFEIAPRVGYYYATDLTPVIIEKNRARVQREGLRHVELKALAASQIDTLEVREFDIFICSSVIHFFPNTLFLEEVIKGAIHLLKDEGIIYLDDMLDLRRKPDFIAAKLQYRQNHPGSRVWQGDEDTDLYVDIDFFRYLQDQYPEIIHWEYSRKLGTIENELTRYRFDVMIKIDKKKANKDTDNPLPAMTTGKGRYTARDIEMQPAVPFPGANIPRTDIDMKDAPAPAGDVLAGSCIQRYSKENLLPVNKPLDLSYVIYTSGTTGTPKGVMIHHQGMLNHIEAKINDLAITANDVIAQTASACFDISVWQFLAGLLTGASTLIIDKESILDPDMLLGIIQKANVTIWESVPSLMTAFLHLVAYKNEKEKRLNQLRWMILTGEALGTHLVKEWYGYYSLIKVLNAYGPTEASDDVTHYVVQGIPSANLARVNVPIGKPIQNTHIYILDRNLTLCPIGVRGEICAAGMGIGRGYWKDPDKTRGSFIPNPYADEIGDPDFAVLYKTGDIGYFTEDGNIQCLGRLDHQVKIRGNRIEPAEIENRLVNHAEITEAAVMVRTTFKPGDPLEASQSSEDGNKYLCAYFVAKPGSLVSAAELREYLAGELPGYMVPTYFVRLERLPLTPNGKIDWKALPTPGLTAGEEYIAPRNELEEKLVKIWAEVLNLEKEKISIDTNFFQVGGHSLRATIMLAKIHKELNMKITLAEIFKGPTIRYLSFNLKESLEEAFISIEPVEKKEFYTTTAAQKRLYFIHRMFPENVNYNIYSFFLIEGKPGKEKIEKIFQRLIQRHEAFRTALKLVDNRVVQFIYDRVDFPVEYSRADASQIDAIIQRFIRPFDLSRAPFLRVGLVDIGENKDLFMIDMHHIISDLVSSRILVDEFLILLWEKELLPLRLQYKDFAAWETRFFESQTYKKQKQYWLDSFSGRLPSLDLPTDYPRPDRTDFKGKTITLKLPDELFPGIKDLMSGYETTPYMTLLAFFMILLGKYTGQTDIVIGSPSAGRPHAHLEHIIGFFVNMLPIRFSIEPTSYFAEFLEGIRLHVIRAFENQAFQFDELIRTLGIKREEGRNPLYDAVFAVLAGEADQEEDNSGIRFENLYYEDETTQSDLRLGVHVTERSFSLDFTYAVQLFKPETAEQMINSFLEIIKQVLANPQIKIENIRIANVSAATKSKAREKNIGFDF